MRLILGSASPRRKELLGQIGIIPDEVRVSNIDETPLRQEKPRPYCRRMAETKAKAIDLEEGEIVLAADTVVNIGTQILGKPNNINEAYEFLKKLSGRRHRVITAVAVRSQDKLRLIDVVTVVKMRQLPKFELDDYIESGEWRGCAGGYSIQGKAGAFIPWLRGSYTSVVGLPIAETNALIRTVSDINT